MPIANEIVTINLTGLPNSSIRSPMREYKLYEMHMNGPRREP